MDENMKMFLTVAGMGLAVFTFTVINYYQVKTIENESFLKTVKGILIYQTKLLPVIIMFSMVVAICFNLGMHSFGERVWVPALIYFAFEVVAAGILAYFFFGEVPSKGTLVGSILCTAGGVVAIIWK